MDATRIASLIAEDLAQHPDFYNSHGVDVDACLVRPERLEFEDSFDEGRVILLWLVLKEIPHEKDGYLVVFDEARGSFGLAVYGKTRPILIGYYGSFTNTLSGM